MWGFHHQTSRRASSEDYSCYGEKSIISWGKRTLAYAEKIVAIENSNDTLKAFVEALRRGFIGGDLMPMSTAFCHILGEHITTISDDNGNIVGVVCPQYAQLNRGCMIKGASPDSFSLKGSFRTRDSYCEFVEPRARKDWRPRNE